MTTKSELDKARKTIEDIWAKLTGTNPCCSCCDSDQEYGTLVNEIGQMIDGRRQTKARH